MPPPDARNALAVETAARTLETAHPREILAWTLEHYRGRAALSLSLGGPSGIVILDLALALAPALPAYYIDTGFLFPETYALAARLEAHYGITLTKLSPRLTVEKQREIYGDSLWASDPDRCCDVRKVQPQTEFLAAFSAWITGIRRDQASTRSDAPVVQWNERHGVVKVNPLARWSERDVWSYVTAHNLPYNDLHDRGYPSIGCTHCTRAVRPGEDARAGRWSAHAKIECGLHA